jgi:ATP-dependent DNA helicase RecQ
LAQTNSQYPALVLTDKSADVLKGKMIVELVKVFDAVDKSTSRDSETKRDYFKDLFEQLKNIRMEFARADGVPPYVIFSDVTLIEMATYLPLDAEQMLKISGVGDVKFKKYGAQCLGLIQAYCQKNTLQSRIELKLPKRERNPNVRIHSDGKSTYEITLAMFQAGQSVSHIAFERKLSQNTIEAHLLRYMVSGEVSLNDIVQAEKVEPIKRAILQFENSSAIAPIKEFLGEDYSYGQINAVMAAMSAAR